MKPSTLDEIEKLKRIQSKIDSLIRGIRDIELSSSVQTIIPLTRKQEFYEKTLLNARIVLREIKYTIVLKINKLKREVTNGN